MARGSWPADLDEAEPECSQDGRSAAAPDPLRRFRSRRLSRGDTDSPVTDSGAGSGSAAVTEGPAVGALMDSIAKAGVGSPAAGILNKRRQF